MGKERVRCFVPEGSQKRKATRVRSLRQRWIVNSVVPIFVLLALIVGGVLLMTVRVALVLYADSAPALSYALTRYATFSQPFVIWSVYVRLIPL